MTYANNAHQEGPPPKGFILPKPLVRWLRSADVAMLVIDCFASLLHLVKPTALALLSTTATATTSRLSAITRRCHGSRSSRSPHSTFAASSV